MGRSTGANGRQVALHRMPADAAPAHSRPAAINVVGTSAVGKTTLARALAALLGVPHVELDALHWEPNWTEAPDEMLRERVARDRRRRWVVDGNYSKVRDLVWERVEAVVWLDLPLRTVLWRTLPERPAASAPRGAVERQPGEPLDAALQP